MRSRWRNSDSGYGWVSILLHWLFALLLLGLFALGWWMVELDYTHRWYYRAPALHEGFGIVLAALLALRWLWRLAERTPAAEPGVPPWQARLARIVHGLLYLLPLAIVVSGYLVSSAGARAVPVFAWFSIPPLLPEVEGIETPAGDFHRWLSYAVIALAALHALAALKHHFVDRDRTLLRMISGRGRPR